MKCYCGGEIRLETAQELLARSLQVFDLVSPYKQPTHKKTRIRKKWKKKYDEEYALQKRLYVGLGTMVLGSPAGNWKCDACSRWHSGYQVLARSLFLIEPMSPGATPIFDGGK